MTELEEDIVASLGGRFWQTVRRYPARPALELGARQVTYRELYRSAASFAQAILDLEDTTPYVAIMADKSYACYAGILGILLAGKAYLPLNPRFPAARNLFMLQKAGCRIILAGENSDEELEEILENHTREIYILFPEEMMDIDGGDLVPKIVAQTDKAYLLFTSGTTGQPKGVPVSHQNVLAYLDLMTTTYEFYPDDRFTQIFDLTFDLSVHDMFLAWSAGACLVVPEDNSSFAMSGFIRMKEPSVFFSVPTVVHLMSRMRLLKPEAFPSIRLSFFCGEALMTTTAKAWKLAASKSGLVNLYGPTEATIAISRYDLPDDEQSWKSEMGITAIGRIFDQHHFLILKENPGDPSGELCLSGPQVVDCYLDDKEADLQVFFKSPNESVKYYKTGDLVKADENGDLLYLGRKDSEVKISGYRVNLKEIENVLETYDRVTQAVLIYREDEEKQGILLAYVLSSLKNKAEGEKLVNDFCRSRLPWYMVPGKIIFVDEIPLNMNGKTDKNELTRRYGNGK